ncbi:unnamed protein product [Heligmosomoides polygyrus]|uniref:DUF7083 domain-containing protein n=1 Tax=Heligmosomoides polygyrus TaxID=6339 RepID=A0A183GFR9_HELPZ|nr:unnamed protein product [Heligmosomoides polygyrus]
MLTALQQQNQQMVSLMERLLENKDASTTPSAIPLPAPDSYGDLVRDLPTFCYDDDDATIFKDWFRRYGPVINDRRSSLPDERKCWISSTDRRIKPIPTTFYHESHDRSTSLLLWTS